ncbi:MAG TPA: MFS transporter, partial [Clostridiales bacterium]|nr:MFS transporter [Clostridiales bacterium]
MLLFTLVYFTSYVTRINYAAIISEIIRSEGILKSTASLALTGSSVAYGIGQILSGYLGDKIQPKTMISAGLLTTIMMNLAVPFLGNPYLTAAVWTVNGLAQAFMWPPLVKIMTHVFTEDDYKKAVVLVSWGSSFGTVAVYLTAPLLITLSGWRAVFVLSALAALVMLIFWLM